MDSSATLRSVRNCSSSRRTTSFSSSSSSLSSYSSCFHEDSPLSPATPLRLSGIPFSWEKLPGIPKKQTPKNIKESSLTLLPLPPQTTTPTTTTTTSTCKRFNFDESGFRKKNHCPSSEVDPFLAALMECSKDKDESDGDRSGNIWKKVKISRSISDRFGFVNLYTSCKKNCSISESIIYLPSSRTPTYDKINRTFRH